MSSKATRTGQHWENSTSFEERRATPNGSGLWERAATCTPDEWCDCCDVAISVPVAWATNAIQWRVIVRQGAVDSLSGSGVVTAADLLLLGTELTGNIHRIRGTQHDSVSVELLSGVALAQGMVRVASWARSAFPMEALLDSDGQLVIEAQPQPGGGDFPGAQLSTRVASAVPVLLEGQQVANLNATGVWLLMWDAAAVPAAGAAPDFVPLWIPANGQASRDFPSVLVSVGVAWAASSTAATYTVPGPATPLWVDTHTKAAP